MLSLIFKILRDKVGELYNSINRKIQPLPFGDDQDYIFDSDTVTVSDFWKNFKKYSQSPALVGVFYVVFASQHNNKFIYYYHFYF